MTFDSVTDIDYAALLDTFRVESEEGLSAMEQALLALEERPSDAGLLQDIFRHAHTLKGNSASLGLEDLAEFTHSLEDVLDRLRSRALVATDQVISLLLDAVDATREMLRASVEAHQ